MSYCKDLINNYIIKGVRFMRSLKKYFNGINKYLNLIYIVGFIILICLMLSLLFLENLVILR